MTWQSTFRDEKENLRSANTRAQVSSCELAIFASNSSRRDQSLIPATSSMNSKWFEFLGQVPAMCTSKGLAWTVRGQVPATWTSEGLAWTIRGQVLASPVPSCKLFMGLVVGTSCMQGPVAGTSSLRVCRPFIPCYVAIFFRFLACSMSGAMRWKSLVNKHNW